MQMNDELFRHTQTVDRSSDDSAINGRTPTDPTQNEVAPQQEGDVILDRFEVKRFLGSGAFGFVFLAYDMDLDRLVAMKKTLPENAVPVGQYRPTHQRSTHCSPARP